MNGHEASRLSGRDSVDSEAPLTTPLERKDIPPQLSATLEHIVGQLDVITQVISFVYISNKFVNSNQFQCLFIAVKQCETLPCGWH